LERTEERVGLERFVIELPADASSLSIARMFASTLARQFSVAEEAIDDIKIAISEACTNAIKAHERAAVDAPIQVSISRPSDEMLTFEIADRGAHSEGEVSPDPSEQSGPDGNLGLLLIGSLFANSEVVPTTPNGTVVRFAVAAGTPE